MRASQADIAGFYELALNLRLVGLGAIIQWADQEIASAEIASEALINLSLAVDTDTDRLIQLLRGFTDGSPPNEQALKLVAGLMHNKVESGELTTAAAADLIYQLTRHSEFWVSILGDGVCWIDELFEDYNCSDTQGDEAVRTMLKPFAAEQLPPV